MWNINKINGIWTYYNRIIKDNGAIVLFSTQPFTTKLINSNIKNYKYSWYWVKNIKGNYLNAKRQPLRQLEEINVFNKHKYYPQGIKQVNKIGRSGSGVSARSQARILSGIRSFYRYLVLDDYIKDDPVPLR